MLGLLFNSLEADYLMRRVLQWHCKHVQSFVLFRPEQGWGILLKDDRRGTLRCSSTKVEIVEISPLGNL